MDGVGLAVAVVRGPAHDDATVQEVAQPLGQAVGHGAYTVSVAVRVQQLSVMQGCVMVERSRQSGRMQVATLKVQVDHGAGLSTRVMNDGQWRAAREVVVIVVRITVRYV